MSVTTELQKFAGTVAAATKSITDGIWQMRARIRAIAEEERRLERASVSDAELQARVHELVQRARAQYLRDHGWKLRNLTARRPGRTLGSQLPSHSRTGEDETVTFGAFALADAPAAERHVLALIRGAGYEAGPDAAAHETALAALQEERALLEAAEEQAVDAAAAAGVMIEHRPEVTKRRTTAASEQKQDAERLALQEARQRELDQVTETRRGDSRIGHSRYLETGEL